MGKRELVIIVGFLVLGIVAYQATAPAAPDQDNGFSIARLIRAARGARATTADRRTVSAPAPASVSTLLVTFADARANVTVRGEDREDVTATLQIQSTGIDLREAEATSKRILFAIDAEGDTLQVRTARQTAGGHFEGRATLALEIHMPRRLALRTTVVGGSADISDVAGVEVKATRADVRVSGVSGGVRADHERGHLTVQNAHALTAIGKRTTVVAEHIPGDATFDLSDGELTLRDAGGAVKIDARRTQVDVESPSGAVTSTSRGGRLEIRDARADLTIEHSSGSAFIALTTAVTVDARITDGGIVVVVPAGGFDIDAQAEPGQIILEGVTAAVESTDAAHSVKTRIGKGGARLSIRSSRGDITLRRAETTLTDANPVVERDAPPRGRPAARSNQ